MKYIILIGDGMADYPVPALDNRTPLEAAQTPCMDSLAARGSGGLVRTIPEGMPPGSAVANLSILGYDPRTYFSGRAPLEAASMGIVLSGHEVGYRCNLITREAGKIKDFSAGHITTEEAGELIRLLDRNLGSQTIRFIPGVSYRNLLVIRELDQVAEAYPPHDIMGEPVDTHYPSGPGADLIRGLMVASQGILSGAEVNKKRVAAGQDPANMIWLWGGGTAIRFPSLEKQYGLKGAFISAVDLVKGIGILAGCQVINVPGATGYLDTNYQGKAEYALKALETVDLVYVHVEAPDEASHNADLKEKIKAIENFDRLVVGTACKGIKKLGDHAILIMPDHRTPISLRTHSDDLVPYAIYRSNVPGSGNLPVFSEKAALRAGPPLEDGHTLIQSLIS